MLVRLQFRGALKGGSLAADCLRMQALADGLLRAASSDLSALTSLGNLRQLQGLSTFLRLAVAVLNALTLLLQVLFKCIVLNFSEEAQLESER